MRRGMAVLAIAPGLVAIAGDLQWPTMTILPGLVASGGALLFGVNAWCLDGRGALWRESLPVGPRLVFAARAFVLGEFLLVDVGDHARARRRCGRASRRRPSSTALPAPAGRDRAGGGRRAALVGAARRTPSTCARRGRRPRRRW